MILQARDTLPSSSASFSKDSFRRILWERAAIWDLLLVGGWISASTLPGDPGAALQPFEGAEGLTVGKYLNDLSTAAGLETERGAPEEAQHQRARRQYKDSRSIVRHLRGAGGIQRGARAPLNAVR